MCTLFRRACDFQGKDIMSRGSIQPEVYAEQMSKIYDVIIIGCGPAGATAGTILARKGVDVLILEKKAFPRFKLCAGMLTQKTFDFTDSIYPGLEELLKQKEIIRNKTKEYCIRTRDKQLCAGRSEDSFVLVDRQQYDHLWYEKASVSGAGIRQEHVVQVDVTASRVVTDSGRVYRARYILGADGGTSRVRKTLAREKVVRPPWSRGAALALETFVSREGKAFPDYPELIVGVVPDGYAWSFPGRSRQRVGICSARILDGKTLKSRLQDLWGEKDLLNIGQTSIQGHVLPYGDYEKNPGYKNVLLLGDAAGLAEPLLGEGIYYAHASAGLAAQAVMECWSKTDRTALMYSGLLGDILKEMRFRWYLRKAGLGLLPLLESSFMSSFVHRFFCRLEKRIQRR